MRAVRKVESIREDLGKVGPVIAEQVEDAMLGRRRRLETRTAEEQAAPLRSLLKFERRLKEQVDKLHDQLQESRVELHLTPEHVRAVVETALELAGQPPLSRIILHDPNGEKPNIEVFTVPALRGSWAACKEGLEHPFTHLDRPIVFDNDAASGRDDVVLAHLNHRLVAMSLRLLRAEGWSPDSQRKLYPVTARIVPSIVLDTPAVIAHGRRLLLAGGNQRLHEELITAGGYLRQGRFAPMNVGQVQQALEAGRPPSGSPPKQPRPPKHLPTHHDAPL